jgi:hypothetical protein
VAKLLARALGKSFLYPPVPLFAAKVMFAPGPVQRFFGMPVEALDYFADQCRYDTTNASRDLAPLDVRCPALPDYADRLVAFWRAKRGEVRRQAMI